MPDDPTPPAPRPGLAQVVTQARALWGKVPRIAKAGAIALAVVVLGGVAWLSLRAPGGTWEALVDHGTPEDIAELSGVLDGRGIPHKSTDAGLTLQVPPERLAEARIIAAAAGLPRSGVGFELFDGSPLGQSSFTEQVNLRRALQGELARSITTLGPIESARVHLALGRRSVFKDADQLPSASVALRMRPGQRLSGDEVRGVKQLVAASVEGLTPEAVVVIDDHGDVLEGDAKDRAGSRAEIEGSIAHRVQAMLEKIVGEGHVAVVATAQLDTSQVQQTEDLYDKDGTALRSEARTVDGANAIAGVGGISGVRGNLPGAPAAAATPGTGAPAGAAAPIGGDGRLHETRNYEVSHVVRQTVQPAVRVQKLHLAVLVDFKPGAEGKPGTARTPEELAQLTALARAAAGIEDTRGDLLEIRSVPFAPDLAAEEAPVVAAAAGLPLVPIAAGAGGALVFFTIVAILVRRRRKAKATADAEAVVPLALPAPVADLEHALDHPGEPTNALPAPGTPSLHERVVAAARADIARTARVLSSWLSEPDAPGGTP